MSPFKTLSSASIILAFGAILVTAAPAVTLATFIVSSTAESEALDTNDFQVIGNGENGDALNNQRLSQPM